MQMLTGSVKNKHLAYSATTPCLSKNWNLPETYLCI